jgi:2,3-bisphosphoglycerate-dependent phosphoglycerate mutase
MRGTGSLVLLRHGESTANAAQEFTGLLDVELTYLGAQQARAAARLLAESDSVPDLVLTSPLQRARETAQDVLAELGLDVPVLELWRLEERDYGVLTGVGKRRAWEQYGPERFVEWRQTLNGRPPAASPEQIASWNLVSTRPPDLRAPGAGESLQDVVDRVRPCWENEIRPRLRGGHCVLVVAHGTSLRALCAVIDGLDDVELASLNLPSGQPLRYDVGPDGRLLPRAGRLLDGTAASGRAAAIELEGGT